MFEDVRWRQRLANYRGACGNLELAVALAQTRTLSDLEQQGLIQSFEFTHELGACRTGAFMPPGFGNRRSRFRGKNPRGTSLESRFEASETRVLPRKMPGEPERPSAACSGPEFRAPGELRQGVRQSRAPGQNPVLALLPQFPAHSCALHPGPLGREQAPKSDRLLVSCPRSPPQRRRGRWERESSEPSSFRH